MEIINNKLGILNPQQVRNFKVLLVQSKLQETINKWMKYLHFKHYKTFDIKDIIVPDSVLARLALEEAKDTFDSVLFYHSFRTYFWSAGFAKAEGLLIDSELLFISAILHDIGLSKDHNHICSSQCFAMYGGSYSQEFCLKNGVEYSKATIVKQAIDLHLNPIVDKKKYGNEAYTLSKGAAMDVIGANAFEFPIQFISQVNNTFIRDGFKEDIIDSMKNLKHQSQTRADILYKMGFASMAQNNKL